MAKLIFEKDLMDYKFQVYDDRPAFKCHEVKQVHGNEVHLISHEIKEGDALVSPHDFKVPLAIKTADCLPIVAIGVQGVAMIHAGWKGLENRILFDKKISSLMPTLFFIGPHISENHYEVGQEFTNIFQNPNNFTHKNGKLYFSLFKEVTNQILSYYPNSLVLDAGICTFADENFHSYRLNKTEKRNWNILVRK